MSKKNSAYKIFVFFIVTVSVFLFSIMLSQGLTSSLSNITSKQTVNDVFVFKSNDSQTGTPRHSYAGTSIDEKMQVSLKKILQKHVNNTSAKNGLIVVMEADSGRVKAMLTLHNSDETGNLAITPWEPGSVIKPLVVATALNEDKISLNTTYYDYGYKKIDGRIISNAINYPEQERTLQDIISKSLNTGAIFVLEKLGEGNELESRKIWYQYLTENFLLDKSTNIGIEGEQAGFVRKPNGGHDLNYRYSGMSFGLGLLTTPLRLASVYGALVNGGELYQPSLELSNNRETQSVKTGVIKQETSKIMTSMLAAAYKDRNPNAPFEDYMIGGKSGTAPLSNDAGYYPPGYESGGYIGFVGKKRPQYIVLTRLDDPVTKTFASTEAAAAWLETVQLLITENYITN